MIAKDPYYNLWRMYDPQVIRTYISQNPNRNCWLEYKGEKYYVPSFINGAQITKQGSPQKFYSADFYNTIAISPTATDGVYTFNIYDE